MSYVLITGASKGIGKAIAEELANNHFNILLIARTEEDLKSLADTIVSRYKVKAAYLSIDLSRTGSVQKIFEWTEKNNFSIQGLVNNAGYCRSGAMDKYPPDENEQMINVNILTPLNLCRAFLPSLKKQKRGYILNIASTASYQAIPLLNVYAACKAFTLSFSRSLYHELKDTSVSVTCVCPGPVDTDFALSSHISKKASSYAKKINMSPRTVAKIAVKSMLNGKVEVIAGTRNKLGVFLVWLLPKKIVEKFAMNIYK